MRKNGIIPVSAYLKLNQIAIEQSKLLLFANCCGEEWKANNSLSQIMRENGPRREIAADCIYCSIKAELFTFIVIQRNHDPSEKDALVFCVTMQR